MCLLVFSYKQHSKYDFIFAANRDELYERPTRPAQFWADYPSILAGKDLSAGGTWMGFTKEGRFSALTNYRDPTIRKENPPSRGHLVLDFLKGDENAGEYLNKVKHKANRYNGFNLIAGTLDKLMYFSNQQEQKTVISPGLHGLSNMVLDTPWPKVKYAKNELRKIIQKKEIPEEALFDLLKHDQPAPDELLPDTGIPKEAERAVSPVFIKTEQYGTRSSTILLVDKSGGVIFEERRFKKGTRVVDDVNRYEFELSLSTQKADGEEVS